MAYFGSVFHFPQALLNQILDQQLPASTPAVGYLTVTTATWRQGGMILMCYNACICAHKCMIWIWIVSRVFEKMLTTEVWQVRLLSGYVYSGSWPRHLSMFPSKTWCSRLYICQIFQVMETHNFPNYRQELWFYRRLAIMKGFVYFKLTGLVG